MDENDMLYCLMEKTINNILLFRCKNKYMYSMYALLTVAFAKRGRMKSQEKQMWGHLFQKGDFLEKPGLNIAYSVILEIIIASAACTSDVV